MALLLESADGRLSLEEGGTLLLEGEAAAPPHAPPAAPLGGS